MTFERIRSVLGLLLVATALAGCLDSPQERCSAYGFSPNSTPWLECVRQIEQAKRA